MIALKRVHPRRREMTMTRGRGKGLVAFQPVCVGRIDLDAIKVDQLGHFVCVLMPAFLNTHAAECVTCQACQACQARLRFLIYCMSAETNTQPLTRDVGLQTVPLRSTLAGTEPECVAFEKWPTARRAELPELRSGRWGRYLACTCLI